MNELVPVLFVVRRDNEATCAVVTAQVLPELKMVPVFLSHLQQAVTWWSRFTPTGYDAWRDSGEDFNVGDLAVYQEDPALVEKLAECGIHDLAVSVYIDTSEGDCWTFDTVLCDDEREGEHGRRK